MEETDEKEAQLTAYYDKEMGELKGAREEYAAVSCASFSSVSSIVFVFRRAAG